MFFSHMWKIDPKDKHSQKQTWTYTNLYTEHVYNSGTTLGTQGEKGKKKRMIESTISKYITSQQVEDIMICIEISWIIRCGKEG
jgi:hypothetical protein